MYQNLFVEAEKLLWMMESMVGSLLSLKGCQIFAIGVGVLCTATKTMNYGSIVRANYQLSLDSKKERKMDERKQPFGGAAIPCLVNPSPMNSNARGVSSHKVIPNSTPLFNRFPILAEDS